MKNAKSNPTVESKTTELIDLEEDLTLKLREHLKSLKPKHKFDADGSGMPDGYVIFDVYDIMLRAGGINFEKRYLAGETIATFKSNGIYKKIGMCKCDHAERKEPQIYTCHRDLSKCKPEKCPSNPHFLGNFMPYPGNGSERSSRRRHSTKQRNGIKSLQELHNYCHKENPFQMLRDIKTYYELFKELRQTRSCYIKAMHFADEDNKFRGEGFGNSTSNYGFYTQFKDFDHFVKTLCFQDFVDSKYFDQNCPTETSEEDYYAEVMRCIKLRTKRMLENPDVKKILNRAFCPNKQ